MSKKYDGPAAFVEVLDPSDDAPLWVRPSEIIQIGKRAKGESILLLASNEVAWFPMGRTRFAKWLAKAEG
ncbi:hypothetical protein UB45_07665 [Terrabacter sp. 28]|nr:hypothetical protein UB45_07665 [Terrabacter sp. 28]